MYDAYYLEAPAEIFTHFVPLFLLYWDIVMFVLLLLQLATF